MYIERHDIAITTAADGSCTAYSPVVTGRVLAVIYTAGTLPATTDLTITLEATTEPILSKTDVSASFVAYPRAGVHNTSGVALTYDGTRTVNEPVACAKDRVKVVVAQGGDTKAGTITVIVG